MEAVFEEGVLDGWPDLLEVKLESGWGRQAGIGEFDTSEDGVAVGVVVERFVEGEALPLGVRRPSVRRSKESELRILCRAKAWNGAF